MNAPEPNELQQLIDLAAPPTEPIGAPFAWAEVERELGLELPGDYKHLADRYGHGTFMAGSFTLNLKTPGHPDRSVDLLSLAMAQYLPEDPTDPHAAFPAAGGLLAVVTTETGDTFWWRTGTTDIEHEEAGDFTSTTGGLTHLNEAALRGQPPVNWGDEDVDLTPAFLPLGIEPGPREDLDDKPDAENPPAAILDSRTVNGALTLDVDLGGSFADDREQIVRDFLAAISTAARAAIADLQTDGVAETLTLRDPADLDLITDFLGAWRASVG